MNKIQFETSHFPTQKSLPDQKRKNTYSKNIPLNFFQILYNEKKNKEKENCSNGRPLHQSYKPNILNTPEPPCFSSFPLHRCFLEFWDISFQVCSTSSNHTLSTSSFLCQNFSTITFLFLRILYDMCSTLACFSPVTQLNLFYTAFLMPFHPLHQGVPEGRSRLQDSVEEHYVLLPN